jgi:hypothetical protein
VGGKIPAIESCGHRLEPVARVEVSHRLRRVPEIVEGLAEAEMNRAARNRIEVRLLDEVSHPLDQRTVGFRHASRSAQPEEDIGDRINDLDQLTLSLLERSLLHQQLPEQASRGRISRRGRDHAAKLFFGFLKLALQH